MRQRDVFPAAVAIWLGALALVVGVLFASLARADSISVSWTAPTQRVDGTALSASEIAGYRLAWTVNGAEQADKTIPPSTTYALDTGVLVGRVCLTLATIDTDGLESDPTDPVCRKAKPNPPSNVRAR